MNKPLPDNFDPWLDVEQICAAISCKKSKAYDLIAKKKIRTVEHPDVAKRVARASWVREYMDQAEKAKVQA